jgi:hypothetical protein
MDNTVPYYVITCLLHAHNKEKIPYLLQVRFDLELMYSVLFSLPKIP